MKMDTESEIAQTGQIITWAYQFGLCSYRWDSHTQRVERIVCPFRRFCRIIFLITFLLLRSFILISLLRNRNSLNLKKFEDIFQIVLGGCAFLTFVFDLHGVWKFDELMKMINTFHVFQTGFASESF